MNKNEFKAGDYIVITSNKSAGWGDESIPNNTVFKQREDHNYLLMELDCRGSKRNGWSLISFKPTPSSIQNDVQWRYATSAEIKAYDKARKPVPALESKHLPIFN